MFANEAGMLRNLRLTRYFLLGVLTLGLLHVVGCAAGNPYQSGTFERGQFFHENNRHTEAVASLETFVRYHPTDSLAPRAQYLKALSYMGMKEYPLAVVELQILAKDYPTSDLIEDAMFQEGMCYFKQVSNPERDVSGALNARRQFVKFSQTYPQSEHMDEVIATMQDISDIMVRKRLAQVNVFKQLKRDEAVLVTLEGVLEKEANSRLLDEVLMTLGESAMRVGKDRQAREMFSRLVNEYPESRFKDRARKHLDNLLASVEPRKD